jgi:hypothetical protein
MPWYPIVPFYSVEALGRDVYSESMWFAENVYATIYSTTPAATVTPGGTGWTMFPHGDEEAWWGAPNLVLAPASVDPMTMAAIKWSGSNVGRHARQWLAMTGGTPRLHLQALDSGGTPLAFTGLPLDYYAPGARWMFARTGWGGTATVVWFQAGDRSGEWPPGRSGHSHADYGT